MYQSAQSAQSRQTTLDRLLSLPAQLEQQHDVSPSQVCHKINSLMTIPDGKKINYAHKLWRRCLPAAVRTNTTSSMVDPTEDQLGNADQLAVILTANPTTAVLLFPSVAPVHYQQPADNHHKQPSQLTELKEGVCGYHRMYGDRLSSAPPDAHTRQKTRCAVAAPWRCNRGGSTHWSLQLMRRRPQSF